MGVLEGWRESAAGQRGRMAEKIRTWLSHLAAEMPNPLWWVLARRGDGHESKIH
jgi:hypothetical protein